MGCDYFLPEPDEGVEPPELLELPEEEEEEDEEDLLSEELDLVSLDLPPPPSVFPPASVLPELLFL